MKKYNKIILGAFFLGATTLLLTGCNSKKNNDEVQPAEEKAKGNCKILECINKIQLSDNLETINTTIGFEGELISEENGCKKYNWALKSDENVEASLCDSGKNSIKIIFENDSIKNKKVDFSKFEELKEEISNGTEVKYEKIVETFKAEGTLVEKNSSTNVYRWVNEESEFMNVSFSTVNGRCTFASGKMLEK